ncbi:MAG TPA: hypothetical protein VIG29_12940 [Vicinamibacteria bacterium]|jgi:hypothetical protein
MNEYERENDALEEELRRLPTPMPSPFLVERVRRLAHLELASRADERLDRLVFAFLLVFSWTISLMGYAALKVVGSGAASIAGIAALPGSSWSWGVAYFAVTWVSGVMLLAALGLYRRRERRLA